MRYETGLAFVRFSWAFDGKSFTKPSWPSYIFGPQGNCLQNANIVCSRRWRMPPPPACFGLSCCGWDVVGPVKDFHPHGAIPVYIVWWASYGKVRLRSYRAGCWEACKRGEPASLPGSCRTYQHNHLRWGTWCSPRCYRSSKAFLLFALCCKTLGTREAGDLHY